MAEAPGTITDLQVQGPSFKSSVQISSSIGAFDPLFKPLMPKQGVSRHNITGRQFSAVDGLMNCTRNVAF
jgi:hypothetical protein